MVTANIVITGPESAGKSVLTKQLAQHFGMPQVPEMAREYFAQHQHKNYALKDVERIAHLQWSSAQSALSASPKILFWDTDLLTIKIWAADKFDAKIDFVEIQLAHFSADFYLLCRPDLPWQPDPLREDENRRDELFEIYRQILAQQNLPFAEVYGMGKKRFERAIKIVEQQLRNKG